MFFLSGLGSRSRIKSFLIQLFLTILATAPLACRGSVFKGAESRGARKKPKTIPTLKSENEI